MRGISCVSQFIAWQCFAASVPGCGNLFTLIIYTYANIVAS